MTKANQKAEIIRWVWWYHNHGFSIIPLGRNKGFWGNNKDELKRPSIKSWDKYKTTPATKEEIQQWIDDNLFKGIGIICGKVSDNLVVIDIDDASIPGLIKLDFDKIIKSGSWVVETGNGFHIYCKHHSNPGGIQKPIRYKIEYRANRGYVVAPPSNHPNGKKYQFMEAETPDDLNPLIEKDVKSIFEEFKQQIGKAWDITETTHTVRGTTKTDPISEYPKCVEIALNTITKHPMRYYTIYGVASSFVLKKIPKDMALKKLKEFNLKKCVPPHENHIIEQAVNGAYEPDAHLWGCEFWMDHAELCPYENIMECPFGKKKAKRELAKEYKIFTYKEKENKKTGEIFYVKDKVIIPNLAELIINEYGFHFIALRDTKELYYYNDGTYHKEGETIISPIAEEYMDDLSTHHSKQEVISHIQDYSGIYHNRDVFSLDPNFICLENGILNLEKNTLEPHTPKHKFISKLPIIYDPKASSRDFEKFLQEICMQSKKRRKDVEDTIQEYMGYGLWACYNYKNYIVFDGGGDNAKTTLFQILIAFYGEDNNTSVSLQELNDRPFAKSKLFGKYVNISDDLPKKALKYSGVIKQITGNSPIWADIKNHKEGIQFVNFAKPWESCNELPETPDITDAFFSRMIQITLLNKFIKKGSPEIDGETIFEADPFITQRLTTPEQLSGILNFAMEGLKRLRKNGFFSDKQTTEVKRETWLKKTNPVYAFITEEIETGDMNWGITVDDFADQVINYCVRNGFDKPTRHKITKKVNDEGLGIRKMQKRINQNLTWCWIGVKSTTDNVINHYFGKDGNMVII